MGRFTFDNEAVELPRGAWARTHRRRLCVEGKELASFSEGAYRPYLYPVFSPSGFCVTTESPADHPHHSSIWIGADHVHLQMPVADGLIEEYAYNLYVNDVFQGRAAGRIASIATEGRETAAGYEVTQQLEWRGPVEWAAPEGRLLLTERRDWTFQPGEEFHLIDVRSQLCAAQWAVALGPTRHAYFNFRVAESMQVVRGGRIHRDGERWIDYSGPVGGGRTAGIALMPWADGSQWWWFSTDWGVVTTGPFRNRARHLAPAATFSLAARYVVHDGDGASMPLSSLYDEFTEKVTKR